MLKQSFLFLIVNLFSAAALADEVAMGPAPTMSGQLIMLGGFFAIFYFLVWRPQSKRAKAHQQLLASLAKGDEVVTAGGLFGKIIAISDQFITLNVAEGVDIKVQKQSIAASMPKGTLKSL